MVNSVPNPEFTTDTSEWNTDGAATMARITSDYNITPACLDVLTGTDFLGVANSGWAEGEHVYETWSGSGYIKAKTGADIGKTVDIILVANGTGEQFNLSFALTNTWQKVTQVVVWTVPGITSLRIDFRPAAAVATAFFLDTVEASQVLPGGLTLPLTKRRSRATSWL